MNERILKIAQETDAWCDQRYLGEDSYDIEWETKFAELIAYECIDLALGSSHREDDMGAIIANKIKQHFGVEE